MKEYFVYIIYSSVGNCYYRGYTENAERRLAQHNSGESRYTQKFTDWKMVYLESFETKRAALIREKGLKKYSHAQISELVLLPKNLLGPK
jgi:putative endonuclease